MLVTTEERQPLAELLYFLELGEQLAHRCAKTQAELAPTTKMRRFLESQARQEAFHSTVFCSARLWIAPLHRPHLTKFEPLEEYEALMTSALDRKDFWESILAEQVILESLGEAILHKLEGGLQKRQAPFSRIRKMLLQQEAAHHGFGERVLQQGIAKNELTKEELRDKAKPYLALSSCMITTLQPRLGEIDEYPSEYLALQQSLLPNWLVTTEG